MQTHAHTDIPNDLFFFLTKIDILENIAEGIKRLFHLGKHLYREIAPSYFVQQTILASI